MRQGKICKEDIYGFYPKARMFGEHGKGKNKAIDVVTDPVEKRVWYEFSNNHNVVYCGPDLEEAIELFNAA